MPISEKKRESNRKWDAANLKRLSLAVPVERYEKMKQKITETGETINGFLNRIIDENTKTDDRQKEYRKTGVKKEIRDQF